MNFVFISPQFPSSYWQFCDRLTKRGVTVLGIGDTPYDRLADEVKIFIRGNTVEMVIEKAF